MHAVVVGRRHVLVANVGILPADGHGIAGLQAGLIDAQVLHRQIGVLRQGYRHVGGGAVVRLGGARVDAIAVVLVLPVVDVGRHRDGQITHGHDAVRQRVTVRTDQAGASRDRALGGRIVIDVDIGNAGTGSGVDDADAVIPGGVGIERTAVVVLPTDVQRTAGNRIGRADGQVGDLQIHIVAQRRGSRYAGAVIALRVAVGVVLENLVVVVGRDDELQIADAGGAVREGVVK